MKTKSNNINIKALLLIVLLSAVFAACSDDNASKQKISVDAVYSHTTASTTKLIEKVRVGSMIRIEGTGLATTNAVYCNGYKSSLNPTYVTANSIIFRVSGDTPVGSEVEDQSLLNTIRIVTSGDDYTFNFQFQAASPTITSISHTLPNAGDKIKVNGTSLNDISSVTFPGDVVVTTGIESAEDGAYFTVTVPSGLTESGSILVEGINGKAYSPNYFNRTECVFMSKFSAEHNDGLMLSNPYCADCQAGNHGYHAWGSNTSGNLTDPLPANAEWATNPEVYRSIPAAPATVGIIEGSDTSDGNSTVGRYCFRSCASTYRVIGLSNGAITTGTSLVNAALQFDYYMPFEWKSGRICFTFVDNGATWIGSFYPWLVNGSVEPVRMDGWETATLPLNTAFSAFAGESYNFMLKQTADVVGNGAYANQGYIGFFNDTVGGVAATEISDFIMYFSNFRIVPVVTPELEDEDED